MEIKEVGSRGTLFTFDDLGIPTNVYVINGKENVYILDTYLGPDCMEEINEYIKAKFGHKRVIVINSHSHWDHVWGNSLYSHSLIIGHMQCKVIMQQEGLAKYEKYKEYKKGDIILTYPNMTFTDRILFEEDSVLIYHTPGHTEDCISVLDLVDKVLFAGDNLERPIPYIMSNNLIQYINTLEAYLSVDAEIIIGGHTSCENKDLIKDNLDYVKKVLSGNTTEFEAGKYADYHQTNMAWLNK
jgi:cyclase